MVMLLVLLMMMTIMMLTRQGEGVQVCEIGVGMIRAQFRYTSSVFTSSPRTIVPTKPLIIRKGSETKMLNVHFSQFL